MKLHHLVAPSLAVALPALANTTTATLDAVDEPGFNEIELTFTPPFLPEGSGTTKLSGTVDVRLEIDPDTDQVSEMTILSGAVEGSPLTLSGSNFAGNYNLQSSTLGANLATPLPPGTVNPATGEFDATQHTFTVSSGTLTGDISVPLAGIDEMINFDFSTMPVGGAGNGTGTVTLTPTGNTPTSKTYDVVVLFPIEVNEVFEVPGPVGPIEIPISAVGTAKLAGPATIDILPSDPYVAWTEANGIAGALFAEDENGDGVPNGLQWGLGLTATENPFPHLLRSTSPVDGGVVLYTLTLPPAGSAANILVEGALDAAQNQWAPVGPGIVSAGNPIPAGTAGTVTITIPYEGSGLFRLSVDAP